VAVVLIVEIAHPFLQHISDMASLPDHKRQQVVGLKEAFSLKFEDAQAILEEHNWDYDRVTDGLATGRQIR
jgi:hypothetical protein